MRELARVCENGRHVHGPHHPEPARRACSQRHPADRRLLPPRELPRRGPATGWRMQDDYDAFYMRRRPARDHGRAGPGDAAPAHPGGRRAAARGRARPAALHPVRAEPRARARAARLGDELPHRLRRGLPDDPVQGQVGQAGLRRGQRRACSPTRSCRSPTSCSTRRTTSRSARTSASTSSSAATSRSASTPATARPSPCPSRTSSRTPRRSWTCRTRPRRCPSRPSPRRA